MTYRFSASLAFRLLRFLGSAVRGDVGGVLVLGAGSHGFFAIFFSHDCFVDGHLVCHTSLPEKDREGRRT